ncbi:MAG: energy-coupling factor transporter transmembrane protein EcfT [Ruminococcus sp.]|jgi:energy-coupling factor transport system permease protein|nr:energy-coupling factor transporter transmembrane protein EcfT [Ruminococcus sp.]
MGGLGYFPGTSFLHKLNPIIKLFIAFILVAAVFAIPSLIAPAGVLVVTFFMALSCQSAKWTLKIIRSMIKFSIVIFIIQTLFIQTGDTLFPLFWGLRVTKEGVLFSLGFVLKLIASALPLALVLRITKGIDLADSLNETFKIPYKYAYAISSAMRFVPDFADEMNDIIEAQTARGIEHDTKGLIKKARLLAPLCLPLLLSGVRKAEIAAISAEMRGVANR